MSARPAGSRRSSRPQRRSRHPRGEWPGWGSGARRRRRALAGDARRARARRRWWPHASVPTRGRGAPRREVDRRWCEPDRSAESRRYARSAACGRASMSRRPPAVDGQPARDRIAGLPPHACRHPNTPLPAPLARGPALSLLGRCAAGAPGRPPRRDTGSRRREALSPSAAFARAAVRCRGGSRLTSSMARHRARECRRGGPLTSESTSESTRRPSDVDSVRCCCEEARSIGTAGFEPATP